MPPVQPLEEEWKKRTDQLLLFQAVLFELAKIDPSDFQLALQRITELDANTLDVERVSVWFFNEERSEIVCENLFQRSKGSHEKGLKLLSEDYPSYFKALQENRSIAADDAHNDPSTREFTETYLKPYQITSMMDVPIWVRGRMVGIVCHEHTGEPRKWTLEERDFSVSIADMVSLAIETSERKKAEEALKQKALELERSNRELEQFVYIASHDLQEPVRKIIAFADRLKILEKETSQDIPEDYLNRIQKAAFQMKKLIEDLLEYSRISSKQRSFDSINLNIILKDVLSNLELRIHDCGARVYTQDLPRVKADRVQMVELFQNLISNAIKFRKKEEPPQITIEGKTLPNGFAEIRILDNGIGFEMKHFEKIFQPFQRLHGKGEYEGSGIGLAICKKIVERHGGKLSAESIPGKGSIFIVLLSGG
jgi:signal transduction histidine kinase